MNGEYLVPEFDLSRTGDNSYFVPANEKPWDEFPFPNSEVRGVYFMMGYYKDNQEQRSLYIGKSSFRMKIGRRFWSHLGKDRNSEHYIRKDKDGRDHYVDYLFSIDLESIGMTVFASALALILKDHYKLNLMLLDFSLFNGARLKKLKRMKIERIKVQDFENAATIREMEKECLAYINLKKEDKIETSAFVCDEEYLFYLHTGNARNDRKTKLWATKLFPEITIDDVVRKPEGKESEDCRYIARTENLNPRAPRH